MKNKLEKQLRSFIDFDYSKRTIDRFHRWMISSDSAEEKETALRNLWFKTKGKAEHDMEYSFRQVLDKIGIEYTPMVTDVNRWNLWKSVAAAAVIVVLSVTATLWISYNHFDRDNIAMVEHYVNNGTRETISLPDGTTVHLNSGSHVFYPENLEGKTRTIYLIGEAEFKVARNPKKPFIVRSSNMAITALGTEFNVKAYPEEDVITASLIEGKVRVDCNDTISYVLTPGICRMLIGEAFIMTTIAVFVGCFLYFQWAYYEGFYTLDDGVPGYGDLYLTNHFFAHFCIVSLLVYVVMMAVTWLGVYIPAHSISRISPVEALRDE